MMAWKDFGGRDVMDVQKTFVCGCTGTVPESMRPASISIRNPVDPQALENCRLVYRGDYNTVVCQYIFECMHGMR